MRYRHILFDLDGTLTDSADGVTRSVQYALDKFGIKASPETLTSFVGPPLQLAFEQEYDFSRSEARQAVHYYREYYREKGIFENRLYPQVEEMLHTLDRKGATLYLATSKPTVFAAQVLRYFQIDGYFTAVTGSNLDGTRAEKSEIISTVLTANPDLSEAAAVMVGDRKHDICGARTCGLDSIAVTYGYGSREELNAARPTHIACSIPELQKLITG